MEKDPIGEMADRLINIDLETLGILMLKADATNSIILKNQARIIAKLEGGDEYELLEGFNEEVKQELAELFKDLHERENG